MYPPVTSAALFRRLETLGRGDLLAKVLGLRGRVETYLQGIGATFAHFTSHAIDHSDQIVRELSSLLYEDAKDEESICVDLGAIEVYLLLLAAYLHDAGMVVTDEEKYAVLASPSWEEFATTHQGIADDVAHLQQELDAAPETATEPQLLFVRSLEQRLLLAEFFRAHHAERMRGVFSSALRVGDDYLEGDPSAIATLAAVCIGHGLNRAELGSEPTYPTRRDIFGEPVNVRFLAILLRLGDLLDMRYDRACPILQSIASPLPRSSGVHWSQYRRITNRVTSPSRIEIRAECQAAEEHRLLLDWCNWIVEEVREAPRLLASSALHARWQAPLATIGTGHETIQIVRAEGARYRAEDWRFTFDENEIVIRLVRDVHRHQFGFLQELLQNALDATRARAYSISKAEVPYPNLLDEETRSGLPLTVRLTVDGETVEAIEVADLGIGMTSDMVRNYFLQVGRSWYRSPDFDQKFNFWPTSRFGVGFLSVFAVSQDVEVTTRWHGDGPDQALWMRLPGPRNYLLFEDAHADAPGTSVVVHLNAPVGLVAVLRYLRATCVSNEFPIHIIALEDGKEVDLESLPLPDSDSEEEILLAEGLSYSVRRVPSTKPGVFGYLEFATVQQDGEAEDWSLGEAGMSALLATINPIAELPGFPRGWSATNGMSVAQFEPTFPDDGNRVRWKVDVRLPQEAQALGLDRREFGRQIFPTEDVESALMHHLEARETDSAYRARLMRRFADHAPSWAANVRCLPRFGGGNLTPNELFAAASFFVAFRATPYTRQVLTESDSAHVVAFVDDNALGSLVFPPAAVTRLTYGALQALKDGLRVGRVYEVSDDLFLVEFLKERDRSRRTVEFGVFPPGSTLIVLLELPTGHRVLNGSHPFIQAVQGIPDDYGAARQRILDQVTHPFSREDNLAATVFAVGQALGSSSLIEYAEILARPGGRRLYAQDLRRLPRHDVPPASAS
jgi:signal transduction histidine kinase